MSRRHHIASLDAFRGIAVAGMILVNNPGNWNNVFAMLTHADWNGCTFADLVFPFFLFIVGAAMPFAFGRRIEGGARLRGLYGRVARRAAALVALGLLLNVVASLPSVGGVRVPGVLQRIGLVYLIATPIVLHVGMIGRAVILVALSVVHWVLLTLPHVVNGADATGLSRAHNLAGLIDTTVFGRHVLLPTGDPEGLLGTLPAVSTTLLGSLAGGWLRDHRDVPGAAIVRLTAAGVAALALGFVWAIWLPLNKSLWTGSFVMVTGGFALLALAACYLSIDVKGVRFWAVPFLWLGANPLAIYFLSELVSELSDKPWLHAGGQTLTVRSWLFWTVLRPAVPPFSDEWLSLGIAVATVALWTVVAGWLFRRGVHVRV